MAGRNSWSRPGPGYAGGGYMGSNSPSMPVHMGFYGGPMDRRPMYNASPMGKPYGGSGGYREDPYRRPRDDYRGGKRPKGKSPMGERRPHHESFGPRKDNRSGKRPQSSGRYEVKVPKVPFNLKSATLPDLKQLHAHLSIPGDFSKACFSWQDAFPMHEPMNVATKTDIYILHRDVESQVFHPPNAFETPDADYSYSVRVMLMASPELAELYKNTCRTADELSSAEKTAVTKNIYFLVGGRTKTETMGIGGPWSPSLDGENPDSDPQTLIRTAIRTFKALTGIDLSSVTEWSRFMEVRYYRCANSKVPSLIEEEEEREVMEDKQEVVVFFVPNISHLMPNEPDWEKTKQVYGDALLRLLAPEVEKGETPVKEEQQPEAEISQVVDTTLDESQEITESASGEPTHYSKLDVNTLKVTELRAELTARNLDIKGVKANLVSRLQAAIEDEKKADAGEPKMEEETPKTEETTPTKPAAASGQPKEESKEITEKDRRRLERLYRLGDKPAILVYPNRAARGGRFDCHRVSLHSLLNYQSEEQKEHNFEVSLFAEQFHEMLQRDCAFTIFKAIYSAPEKDVKDAKPEQNGVSDEPDAKRRRNESESSQHNEEEGDIGKIRRLRRTVDIKLLFSFTYFDSGHSGFIRDYDLVDLLHLLGLGYSKSQMKKMVARVTARRDHVQYRSLTDADVAEDGEDDVVTLKLEDNDPEFLRDLAAGNDILFGGENPQVLAKTIIVGSGGDADLLKRMQAAEEVQKSIEFQFYRIKDELEKTRVRLNACKDTEDKLRSENRDYQNKFKEEQKNSRDNKVLVSTYNHLLRHSRDIMSNAVSEIDKQFEKEKAKRDAEKAEAEAEKAKIEAEKAAKEETSGEHEGEKNEEKDWEVVDQV